MAARVEEAYSERTEKVNASGEIVEIEIHYLVFEAADEDAALAAARTKAKAKTVTRIAHDMTSSSSVKPALFTASSRGC